MEGNLEVPTGCGILRVNIFLMLHYACPCCEEPFGVDFVEIG